MKITKHIGVCSLIMAFALMVSVSSSVFAQIPNGEPQTVTLLARSKVDEVDNYRQATFSFMYGVNGDAAMKLTRNSLINSI